MQQVFDDEAKSALTGFTTFTAGANVFCIQPGPRGQLAPFQTLPSRDCVASFSLATVVNWDKESFAERDLEQVINDFSDLDDVWIPEFLTVVVLRVARSVTVESRRDKVTFYIDTSKEILPDGPYAMNSSFGNLFAVCRLFEDEYCAFIGGSVQRQSPTSFGWSLSGGRIAVPSRLYYKQTVEKPLAGLRFAVKDVIDVAGLETGCGNRSYRSLYPCKKSSATCVQRLLDAGAVLVGKTKTTQFAEGQEPSEWFDTLFISHTFGPRIMKLA